MSPPAPLAATAAAAALLLGLTLTACHKPPPAENITPPAPAKPIDVTSAKVESRDMPRYLRVTGQLQAAWDAMVASDAAGKVESTPVERGAVVKAGDVLVKLDERVSQINLREAESSVALAKAQADLSGSEYERNQPLAAAKAIAQADLNRLRTDTAAKDAQLAAAEARRDMAQKSLKDAVILSPFAGTVAERLVSPGEYVQPGKAVARVVDTHTLRLLLNVPEAAVGRVKAGQTVEFTVSAYPKVTFQGKINFIGAAVREASRDLLVEAEVDNQDGRLKPGLFAEARLTTGEEKTLAVPAAALRIDGTKRRLYVIKNNQLEERLVDIGENEKDWVEIRQGGVSEGEAVVLKPGPDAADGVPVVAKP
ncbi:efflux RND transporter periplasmic adaptor subunit [Brevifollis gellanilyticus]|uniref:Resistance-nodulation-cell division (RND) efflux membrane fusion protein n=1 Tax=Brevifollis gellanilyticus TaxID=748831 RepID=A0A512M480_9BACT|nr:efflux RND transporter periplasmic adaptor subunit [Brevifollis gellanilyticus]GEP41533.1 resistance-nodulation-cell division (RND) efflux membrane fusion protein [Brevifollis gellanilyticus]